MQFGGHISAMFQVFLIASPGVLLTCRFWFPRRDSGYPATSEVPALLAHIQQFE